MAKQEEVGAFLAALTNAAKASSDDDNEAGMTNAQQIGHLKTYAVAIADRKVFAVGDIVVHKFPDGATSRTGDQPGVVTRILKRPVNVWEGSFPDPSEYFSNHATASLDIIIGFMMGKPFVQYLADSSAYRHMTKEELGPMGDFEP